MRLVLLVLIATASTTVTPAHAACRPGDPLCAEIEPSVSGETRAALSTLMKEADAAYTAAVGPVMAQMRPRLVELSKQLDEAIAANKAPGGGTDAEAEERRAIEEARAKLAAEQSQKVASSAPGSGGSSSSVEGLIVEGVLKFVARRAREEAVHYVVRRLEGQLCGHVHKAGALLPNTCGLLETIGRSSDAVAPLELLRQSVRADLRELPTRLSIRVAAEPSLKHLACGLQLGTVLGAEVLHADSAGDIEAELIDAISTPACIAALGSDGASTQRYANSGRVALRVLHDGFGGYSHTTASGAKESAKYILGARLPEISAEMTGYVSMADLLKQRLDQVLGDGSSTEGLKREATRIAAEQAKVRAKVEQVQRAAFGAYEAARAKLVQPVLALVDAYARPVAELERAINDLQSRETADRKPLVDALLGASGGLLQQIVRSAKPDGDPDDALARVAIASAQFPRGEFMSGMAGLLGSGMLPADREPYRTVVTLAELLAGLSDAQSSEEVAALIEAAAPPAGSWEQKRRRTTVGLSAQFGIAGGVGWTRHDSMSSSSAEIAAAVPIGLDVARPAGRLGSLGLLLQVIDLGALSSTRLSESSMVKQQPNVSVASVFAPGAILYLGVGHTPFVVSAGLSYAPALRKLADDTTAADLRFQVGVAVDVPFLIF